MIRTDHEYRESMRRLEQSDQELNAEEKKLRAEGLSASQAKKAMQPSRFFSQQIQSELESYERLKRGEFDELTNLTGIGQLLIGLRIACGLSQRELADKLGVHESLVSRDEKNEYAGISVERANRIIETMGVEVRTRVARVPALKTA